jgi:hypothetical protein
MKKRKILTIHNHPKRTYSPPSHENFEILGHEFEDYEIICAENEFWILEAKGKYDEKWVCDVKKEICRIFEECRDFKGTFSGEKLNNELNKIYEKELKIFINNLNSNIKLSKKEYASHDKTT